MAEGEENYWSVEDRDLAAMMLAMGFTPAQVGAAVDAPAWVVAVAIGTGNLLADPEVSRLDRSPGAKRTWTADEETLLARLTERGCSDKLIGGLLGRSATAIQQHRFRLSIENTRFPSKQKGQGRWRPCMCCQRRFRSEGIHNRICDPCKGTEVYRLAS